MSDIGKPARVCFATGAIVWREGFVVLNPPRLLRAMRILRFARVLIGRRRLAVEHEAQAIQKNPGFFEGHVAG